MQESSKPGPDRFPHLDPHAEPIEFEPAPPGRKIVFIKGASYRNAVFDGYFVVADSADPHGRNKTGQETIDLECYWYGWRPIRRWIRVTVPSPPEYLEGYKGKVVTRIGRK
jgi:hypothetical protein